MPSAAYKYPTRGTLVTIKQSVGEEECSVSYCHGEPTPVPLLSASCSCRIGIRPGPISGVQLGVVEAERRVVQHADGEGRRHRRCRSHARLAAAAVALRLYPRLHARSAVRPERVQVRDGGRAQISDRRVPRQGRAGDRRHRDQPPLRRLQGQPRHLLHLRGRHVGQPPGLGPAHDLPRRHHLLRRHRQPRHRCRLRRRARHRPPQRPRPARAQGMAALAQERPRLRRVALRLRQGLLPGGRQGLHRRHGPEPRRGRDLGPHRVRRRRQAGLQPGRAPAGAGELGGQNRRRGVGGRGVRLHDEGDPERGRGGRAVAADRPAGEGARRDGVVAGEGRHLRRQPRHRLHAGHVALPCRQGHAGLRLHPHAPRQPMHLLRPFLQLGVQGRNRRPGGGEEAQQHHADERSQDPHARRRCLRRGDRRQGGREDRLQVRRRERDPGRVQDVRPRQRLRHLGEGPGDPQATQPHLIVQASVEVDEFFLLYVCRYDNDILRILVCAI